MNKQSGFTLIELLIAVSLLSALMFTGSYVYSVLSTRWDRELGDFNHLLQEHKGVSLLRSIVEGTMPWITIDKSESGTVPAFFFVGDNDSLLGVTRRGIFSEEYPEIFRITAVRNTDDTFHLLYQASSTQNLLLLNTSQEVQFENQLVLADKLKSFEFNYFGYADFQQKGEADPEVNQYRPEWRKIYSGIDARLMPERIEISLVKDVQAINTIVELDPKSTRYMTHFLEWQSGQ